MTQWKRDTRPENVRTFGDFKIFSEVDKDRRTAHVVRFPDGEELRALPSEWMGGHKRAQIVHQAVEDVVDVWEALVGAEGLLVKSYDPVLYLQGALHGALLEYEVIEPEQTETIDEWLGAWFEAHDVPGWFDLDLHGRLLRDLDADGWEIVRDR